MDQRARDILKIGDDLFAKKGSIDSLWQEIALNFYPERADFTTKRSAGEEFSDHLFSSFPAQARRELGNLLSASLRPRSQDWFSIHVEDEDIDNGTAEREYLERLTKIQRKAMYDNSAGFVRATKLSDHDFATFGNAVIKVSTNIAGDGLLFRNYHLRDNAWSENAEGKVDCNHRNWEPTARQLKHHFPKTISSQVQKACEKSPEKTFKCRHVVVPSRAYDYKSPAGKRFPFVSLYVERESETVLEEVGLNYFCYVIPRWLPISQYGTSMATSIILPDGRTMQVVTRTLREAGEKYTDPPMVAVSDAIRGDIALYAGGVTTVEMEYDERLGEVLRPISQQKGGFPIGADIAAAIRADISSGFFLDKIKLPEIRGDATAYQVRKIIEDTIRSQAPIFEPIEEDYNDPVCELSFNVMRDHGAFPVQDMPESLMGSDIKFSFRSPLADMAEQRDAEIFVDGMTRILAPVLEVDPAQIEQVDITEGTRDALRAHGFRAKWFKPKGAVAARQQQLAKQATMAKGMEALGSTAAVMEQGGKAAAALEEANV
jgi:hypothetical protein